MNANDNPTAFANTQISIDPNSKLISGASTNQIPLKLQALIHPVFSLLWTLIQQPKIHLKIMRVASGALMLLR